MPLYFDRNFIESIYHLSIVILTMLSLPVHDHGMSFHLFMPSLIKQQCFAVFSLQVFNSFVKFIPKHLILFDAIVSGIVFLISFSECSLLVYRIAAYFCVNIVSCRFAEFIYWLYFF